jgi:hypothetical protein
MALSLFSAVSSLRVGAAPLPQSRVAAPKMLSLEDSTVTLAPYFKVAHAHSPHKSETTHAMPPVAVL